MLLTIIYSMGVVASLDIIWLLHDVRKEREWRKAYITGFVLLALNVINLLCYIDVIMF